MRSLRLLSSDEFLASVLPDRPRSELVKGVIHVMTGGTARHNKVTVNAVAALVGPSRSLGCELFIADMALQIDDSTVYYPDLMATCDPSGDELRRTAPCLIIEVLSPSTSSVDEREKRVAYTRVVSVRDYLIVHPDDAVVDHHHRETDGSWSWKVRTKDDVCGDTCLGDIAVGDLFVGL